MDQTIVLPPLPSKRSTPLLVATISTGSLAVASAIVAQRKNEAMRQAQSIQELNKHYAQQRILRGTSITSLGAMGISGGLYFFW